MAGEKRMRRQNQEFDQETEKVASSVSFAVAGELLTDIRRMIEEVRSGVAKAVNAGLTMLYWRIGKRIGGEILKGRRAAYGRQIVATLLRQLSWKPFRITPSLERAAPTRILCRNVPARKLGHPNASEEDRLHAVRTHRNIP